MNTRTIAYKAPHILLIACLVALFLALPGLAGAQPEWHKGATIRSSSPEAFTSPAFQRALEDWAGLGGNIVTLVLPWQQETLNSSEVRAGSATPSEQALIAGIQAAHDLGLAVNLLPHLDTETHEWRAQIEPNDLDTWFQSYSQMLLSYAQLAEQHGVEMVTIGTELVGVTGPENTQRWRDLIDQLREAYTGELTYSANWGGDEERREAERVEFWDDLDYIGIAAYFEFDPPHNVTMLREQWNSWEQERIGPLQEEWDMPVLFTEIGYRSVEGALERPWDWELEGSQDMDGQAAGYEALLAFWSQIEYFRGVHIWDWRLGEDPAFWQSEDWAVGYTPQRKPAEDVLAEQFAAIPESDSQASSGSPVRQR